MTHQKIPAKNNGRSHEICEILKHQRDGFLVNYKIGESFTNN